MSERLLFKKLDCLLLPVSDLGAGLELFSGVVLLGLILAHCLMRRRFNTFPQVHKKENPQLQRVLRGGGP